jgi:hypothetical protein
LTWVLLFLLVLLKIAVVPDMNDDIIIRFIEPADPETIEKVVIGMILRREIGWLGDKSRKKFFRMG